MTAPDPVVTLFKKWEPAKEKIARCEAERGSKDAPPDGSLRMKALDKEWEALYAEMEALEFRMMDTLATSAAGIYAKLKVAEYWIDMHHDPIKFEDLHDLDWENRHVISVLRDAAGLAGAS